MLYEKYKKNLHIGKLCAILFSEPVIVTGELWRVSATQSAEGVAGKSAYLSGKRTEHLTYACSTL